MRPQTMLVVVLALAFGGVAAGGVFLFSNADGSGGSGQKSTIVVVTADIPRGAPVPADAVAAREYPKDLIPEGVVTKVQDAIGRPALTGLFKDEPVLDAKLGPKGTGGGLASLLKHGMRAVTITTSSAGMATNIAAFIDVGSHVDIHWTPPETGRDPKADAAGNLPLLENVEVIAVDDKLDGASAAKADAGPAKSVTVQLKPEDAAILAPALTRGSIHLSLRNPTDEGRAPRKATPPPAAPAPRREVAAAPAAPPAPAAPLTIRTLRGTREGVIRLGPPATNPAVAGPPAASPPAAGPPADPISASAGAMVRENMMRLTPFGGAAAPAVK